MNIPFVNAHSHKLFTVSFLLGLAVGWLLIRRRPGPGWPVADGGVTYMPPSYRWTSADGTVTVAWPDDWYPNDQMA